MGISISQVHGRRRNVIPIYNELQAIFIHYQRKRHIHIQTCRYRDDVRAGAKGAIAPINFEDFQKIGRMHQILMDNNM